ncbi:hypothetical protein B0T25DRAFT_538293 [Lasiosphaeria hispida]|uniref:Secreted protein n=1 Tax=Lasiosphaeria hispida TaxID=260671 RepID=A0AAJ0HM41_9PEZI|nr:hypothetical protein B0T25DRAFT_538293 [Lasiosphaeria hispida]
MNIYICSIVCLLSLNKMTMCAWTWTWARTGAWQSDLARTSLHSCSSADVKPSMSKNARMALPSSVINIHRQPRVYLFTVRNHLKPRQVSAHTHRQTAKTEGRRHRHNGRL